MKFEKWINKQLKKGVASNIVAYNFNLYETSEDGSFDVELVGCDNYDRENEDWACNAIFSSESYFSFKSEDWEKALEDFEKIITDYFNSNTVNEALLKAAYVTYGFVDGDLYVVVDKGN